MKILLTGADGQIGWELRRTLSQLGTIVAPDRQQLDLSHLEMIAPCVQHVHPNLIINAAGYTAVDRAEEEPDLADRVNGEAPGVLAAQAKKCGAAIIHYSTDYVFDGTKASPYVPDDKPNPISAYGRSKLLGEQSVMKSGAEALVLRLSWVYGLRRSNFLRAILDQAEKRDRLTVVNDQHGCPTWCRLVAEWTAAILNNSFQMEPGGASFIGSAGLYHLSCTGKTTWFEFARRIIEMADLDRTVDVSPCTTAEYPRPAQRPKQSVLDCSKTIKTFNLEPCNWDDALQRVMAERRAGLPARAKAAGPRA